MTKPIQYLCAVCAALFSILIGAGASASDFAGTWQITEDLLEGPFNQEELTCLTIHEAGDEWTGSIIGRHGSSEIENLKLDGDTLSFASTFKRMGLPFDPQYEATLQDGKLVGTIKSPRGDRTFTGERVDKQPTFEGEWEVTIYFNEEQFPAHLSMKQVGDAVTGTWIGPRGETELEDALIIGKTLTFTRAVLSRSSGVRDVLPHTAILEGDEIAGKFMTPGSACGAYMTFKGTRKPETE